MSQRLNLRFPTRPCGKIRHYTKPSADGHRMALEQWEREKGPARPGILSTYWCNPCQAYHVGHSSLESSHEDSRETERGR
jgi:hypothetical protein